MWMVEPHELYSRGSLPFSVQPIFYTIYDIVHNGRSSSWLLHSHKSPRNHSFLIQPVLVLSHHCIMSSATFLLLATAQGAYSHHSNMTCIICLQNKARHLHPLRDLTGKSLNFSSLLSPSLPQSLGLKDLISAANFFACTIFMISISASLSKLLLIIWPVFQIRDFQLVGQWAEGLKSILSPQVFQERCIFLLPGNTNNGQN